MAKFLSIAALASLVAVNVWAEEKAGVPKNAGSRPAATVGAGQGHRLNNPLNPAQRFLQMTPEEQQRLMERANPQQQERMRAALERYNSLPPMARERLFRQYEVLKGLPVGQQALISRQFRAFNELPDERRGPVGRELLLLHRMAPEERAARLENGEFGTLYSPNERQILKDLSLNLPSEYPLAGR